MIVQLKTIFANEWEDFKLTSKSSELQRKAVHDNVYKLLHCKTAWMGIQIYQCKNHPKQVKLVPCTCKSRFCPSCGFKANTVWLYNLMERIIPCDYQHLIFTLPYQLRDLAKANRSVIFNLMSKCLYDSIKQFISNHKNFNYTPGAVSVLHTFGKGLKWHIHFHVLLTAGGIRDNKWVPNTYINENYLKRAWKAKLLKGLRKLYKQHKLKNAVGSHPAESFLSMLSNIYEKAWYVWIDKAKDKNVTAFSYIGRYCKRACISQRNILEYRPNKLVKWKDKSRVPTPDICAYRCPPFEFIDLLVTHIPDRYTHQVRYYGLYSPKNTKLYSIAFKIFKRKLFVKKVKDILSSKFNRLMSVFHELKPLTCPICNNHLELTGIIFLNPFNPSDKNILLNCEIKNYELVEKSPDSS